MFPVNRIPFRSAIRLGLSGFALLAALIPDAAEPPQEPVVIQVAPPSDPAADAAPALRQAIEQARNCNGRPVTVALSAGTYRIDSLQPGNAFHLVVAGNENLTIAGVPGKTLLLFSSPGNPAIGLFSTRNVWLKDLTLDYAVMPFTQGTVTAVDAANGTFDWRLDPGYPNPTTPFPIQGAMAVIIDRAHRALKAKTPDFCFLDSATALPDGQWRLTFDPSCSNRLNFMAPGDAFVALARLPGGTIEINDAEGGGLDGVTMYSSPGLSLLLNSCRTQITVRGFRVGFKPDSDRLISSNGDGVHCGQNRVGPLIEDCSFEGLCDDGVNIYCTPARIEKTLPEENAVIVQGAGLWQSGDRIQFFDLSNGRILAEAAIVRLEAATDTMVKAGFETLPALDPQSIQLFNLSASGENFIIRRNLFRNHRRHGLNLRSRHGVIADNRFEEQGGFGINISNEPGWPEGPIPGYLVIRNNVFVGGGRGEGYYGDTSASLRVQALKNSGLAAPVVEDIEITGNEFTRGPATAIFLGAVRSATLRGNHCAPGESDPTLRVVVRDSESVNSDTPIQ